MWLWGTWVGQTGTSTATELLNAGASDEWDAFGDFGDPESATPSDEAAMPLGVRLRLHGFAEAAASSRVVEDDQSSDDFLLGEARGRLEVGAERGAAKGRLKLDFIGDAVAEEARLDLREIWVDYSVGLHFSVRAGRQILTWGTGDFLFLNDLFPKDFQSFFLGRSDEFLKAPSDSLKASVFFRGVSLDFVWTPIFAPDVFISGERLSFFLPPRAELVGPSSEVTPVESVLPEKDLENGEFAARIYGNVSGWEWALYAYVGFFKQPLAFDPVSEQLTHTRLVAPGASLRGLLFGGVLSLETSYYHSVDDAPGTDPFVPNSQFRGLAGYEFEVLPKFTVSFQYFIEWTLNHDALIENSPFPEVEPDRLRHVVTTRVTYLLLSDNLRFSLFGFASPSDVDAHLRPSISYKLTEALEAVVGGIVLFGRDDFTFFGQLERNTSVYGRMRYSF
ncbi:MAG: hypothetical protein ACFB9M_05275 [Myxococcota bacterium]